MGFDCTKAAGAGWPEPAWRAQVWRGERAIRRMHRRLARPEPAGALEQFICASRLRRCRPVLVAVWQGRELAGMVYAGEPNYLGCHTGVLAVGDGCGDDVLAARAGEATEVLAAALAHVVALPRYHTIYINDKRGEDHGVREIVDHLGGIRWRSDLVEMRNVLVLGDRFEDFLAGLGRHTRRNLMYYRRRAEAAGLRYASGLNSRELARAAQALLLRQRSSRHTHGSFAVYRRALRGMPGAFWCGLRDSSGAWMALLGGWREDHRACIATQLNDGGPQYEKLSLSTVIRSYAIEEMMREGVREVRFFGDCKGILELFCRPDQRQQVVIERRTWASDVIRAVGRRVLQVPLVRARVM